MATCTESDSVEQRKLLASTALERQQAQGLETPGMCDQGGEAKSRRTGQSLCKKQSDLGAGFHQQKPEGTLWKGSGPWVAGITGGEGGVEDS